MNQKMYKAIGIGIPLTTSLLLFGLIIPLDQNLYNTGITAGIILGIGNLLLSYWIYKNYI